LIDGENLKEINIAWWRNQIGYVEQQPRLFPGTIRDNIALGMPGQVTDDQVMESAKMACAHDFIMDLPEGYDTFYSGTSLQLSGGQMQRIAIARAIIRNPAVLILDEATSALDSQSESSVQMALGNIRKMRKMTTVTIAHRLTTIVDSDQIAVLSNGELAELGDHKSLMENGGIYSLLCESQGITKDFTSHGSVDDAGEAKVDPGKDGIEQPLAETDGVLILSKEEGALVEVDLAPMSKIMAYVGKDAGYMALGIVGSIIVGALSPAESILTGK
jgi:ATP-binding cassette subfamily B (MDR/TAP) protein 1